MEAEGITGTVEPQTIEVACQKFLADAKARNLRETSLYKYHLLFVRLREFAAQRGIVFLSGLGVGEVRAFRESWPNSNLSARKRLEHLRAFFRFCNDSGWIKDNPAKGIKAPEITDPPVLPFSDSDMRKLIAACATHKMPARAVQLHALVLLMRHSGLRIGDASTLRRDRIDRKGILDLYTAKSGTKVRLPLKPEVITALGKIPKSGDYYFWNGQSKPTSCVKVWENTFARLFERAGIEGTSHRLRHTFAVQSLARGMSMGNLSTLLGHRSIKVTEKYYANWDESRQMSLEKAVRKTW